VDHVAITLPADQRHRSWHGGGATKHASRITQGAAKIGQHESKTSSTRTHAMSDWSDEETDDPLYADDRNFYKVELWTKDEQRVLRMLYAGNNLDKARTILANYIRIRPRARITIRQRTRVLDQWPRQDSWGNTA
jgi:hypothetical protein